MKNLLKTGLLFIFLHIILYASAQNNSSELPEDINRIILTSFLPEDINLPDGAASLLTSKLNQITTKSGMGGTSLFPRFILVARPIVIEKDIISSAPPKQVYTVNLSLQIGDGIQGTLFASEDYIFKGIGETEEKAYLAALKMLNPQDPRFTKLLTAGKEKIIAHYNAQCKFILTEARTLASQKKYDEAISILLQVPDVSEACFDSARQESVRIFNQKIEMECQTHIAAAKALIAQDKWDEAAEKLAFFTSEMSCYPEVNNLIQSITNHQCAIALGKAKGAWAGRNIEMAAEALAEIPSDSKCYEQAKKLNAEIAAKLDARERAAWNLAYEKYNRNQVLREKEAAHQQNLENRQMTSQEKQATHQQNLENRQMSYQEKQGFELEKARIQAIREVGIAYGKNQPRRVTYNIRGW